MNGRLGAEAHGDETDRSPGTLRPVSRPTPPVIAGLSDAHCHLDYTPMADDVSAALRRAADAGVERVVHVGCSRARLLPAVELAQAHRPVYASIGIHPHEADTIDDDVMEEIAQLSRRPKVVAIGETGLDYHYDRSPRHLQKEGLVRHAALAHRLGLPLVLHIRDAHDDALALLTGQPLPDPPGMVHCFTGGPKDARAWLDLGFCLSFSGITTFKGATEIREAAALCPPERLLLETDAPYLAPVPMRGRPNEPAYVSFTCANVAALRQVTPETLAATASANLSRLLGLVPSSPAKASLEGPAGGRVP